MSCLGIFYNNENTQIVSTNNNMNDSHKHNVE